MFISAPVSLICNNCAIIAYTERMTERLLKLMKKVFAWLTEDVRYRTDQVRFERWKNRDSFRKMRKKCSFNQKGMYFAVSIQETQMIKNARKDFNTFFWYNNLSEEGFISWIKKQEKYS